MGKNTNLSSSPDDFSTNDPVYFKVDTLGNNSPWILTITAPDGSTHSQPGSGDATYDVSGPLQSGAYKGRVRYNDDSANASATVNVFLTQPSPTPSASPPNCDISQNPATQQAIAAVINDYEKAKQEIDRLLADLSVHEPNGFSLQAEQPFQCPTSDDNGMGACMSDTVALANFIAQNETTIDSLEALAWQDSTDAYLSLSAEVGLGAALVFVPGGAEYEMVQAMERMLSAYQKLSPVAKAFLMSKYGPQFTAVMRNVSLHMDDVIRGLQQLKDDTVAGINKICGNDLDNLALAGGPNSPTKIYSQTKADLHQAKPMQMAKKGNGKKPQPVSDYTFLSKGEEKALKKASIDIHDYKPNARYDLYKDTEGNIYVLPKGNPKGAEPDPTNLNINDYL